MKRIIFSCCFAFVALLAMAQQNTSFRQGNIESPVVNQNGSVTFRISAPKAKTKGLKVFRALYYQNLDPDPRVAGNWFIGEPQEIKEEFTIAYSKNYIRIDNVSYFIDKSTLKTQDYTPEQNPGYGKSTAFAAQSIVGEEIFVTMEYGNREDPRLYGFSVFDRANQGHFYLTQLVQ